MTYRIVPCPKCDRLHGVVAVRANHKPAVAAPAAVNPMPATASGRAERVQPVRRGPAAPFDGPWVSPLRSETPRDGRESSLSDSPLGRSRSRSSQAASPQPSVVRGSTD